jgi:uncharacterized protein (DUF488 family)
MEKKLFTIGHGSTGVEEKNLNKFIEILNFYSIKTLVDIRSYPVSNFASWFNKQYLEKELTKHKIKYRFAGKLLGGRPKEEAFYDKEGYVLYNKMAESNDYKEGLDRLKEIAQISNTVIMCSEKRFEDCHRSLLIARTLGEDWKINHIISIKEVIPHEFNSAIPVTLSGDPIWKSVLPIRNELN